MATFWKLHGKLEASSSSETGTVFILSKYLALQFLLHIKFTPLAGQKRDHTPFSRLLG
jgi:hypothetical protein